jgi:DNA polymerase-3 subunit epsilon/ATP-dependent DNA helicase DinG
MLKAIAEAFDIPSHLLVEAGTGTGKSVAYLLPAAYFAAQNGQRVIISSNTINLQDQLYNKDVPDLQRILPISFSVAMLKGRANYICLRRLTALRRSTRLSVDETRVLAKVLAWLPTTRSGDRTELLLFSSENDIWTQLHSSSETCLGEACAYFRTGQCFFQRARARAERAHLVIINHALLLSDIMLDNRLLPEYQYLIIDEAHHLEEQATNQFGLEVGRQDIYAFLNSLGHERNDLPGGLLAQIPVLYTRDGLSETARQAIGRIIDETNAQINIAEQGLYALFNAIELFLSNHADAGAKTDYDRETRLTEGLRIQPDWSEIEIAWENLSLPLRQVLNGLERLAAAIEKVGSGEDAERDELLMDLRTYLQRGLEMWGALNQILFEPNTNGSYWVTTAQRTQEITLHSAPLHVGPLLRERLFDQKACVVLTSATLRTEGSFSYIESRLNMEDPMELALDSPFDLKSAVLLYVPKDMPEPNQPFYQKQVEQTLVDLCKATEGRTLVLFTSNSQLHATYRAIQPALEEDGIVVFGQGLDGSRMQVIDNFRSTAKSVLLGTRSFWEGIDIVGQALSCLVITRLPFAVPTDPVFAARAETFDDAFNQYYLPDAILRFRQGFGRLVRSKEDYGIIVLLDNRLLTRAYGKTILRSLPPCTARQGPVASLPAVAQRWLDPANRS